MSQSTLWLELPLASPLAYSVTHSVVICILLIAALQLLSPDKPLGAELTKLFVRNELIHLLAKVCTLYSLSFALFDNLNSSTLHIWSITVIQFYCMHEEIKRFSKQPSQQPSTECSVAVAQRCATTTDMAISNNLKL